jgi:hypothetical protein
MVFVYLFVIFRFLADLEEEEDFRPFLEDEEEEVVFRFLPELSLVPDSWFASSSDLGPPVRRGRLRTRPAFRTLV